MVKNFRAFFWHFSMIIRIFYCENCQFWIEIINFMTAPEFSSSRNPEVSSSISPVGNSWMGFSFSTLIVRLIFLLCPPPSRSRWPEPIIWEQFRTFSFMLHQASEEKSQISFVSFRSELHSEYLHFTYAHKCPCLKYIRSLLLNLQAQSHKLKVMVGSDVRIIISYCDNGTDRIIMDFNWTEGQNWRFILKVTQYKPIFEIMIWKKIRLDLKSCSDRSS